MCACGQSGCVCFRFLAPHAKTTPRREGSKQRHLNCETPVCIETLQLGLSLSNTAHLPQCRKQPYRKHTPQLGLQKPPSVARRNKQHLPTIGTNHQVFLATIRQVVSVFRATVSAEVGSHPLDPTAHRRIPCFSLFSEVVSPHCNLN